ncbi:MAG: thermitase [Thermoproteota archaeon]|jgi:thermitase
MQKPKSLIVVLTLILSSFTFAATVKNDVEFDSTRLIVKFKTTPKITNSKTITKIKNLFGNIYVVYSTDIKKVEAQLKLNTNVIYIEKNYKAGKRILPKLEEEKSGDIITNIFSDVFNDPKVGNIWSFDDANQYGVSVERSYLAPLSRNKEEVIVAVVDTGVDYSHEDLSSVMWVNTEEIPGNGIDDDQNGYIDDVHGIDTLERDSNGNATGDPFPDHSHGTHVSGTIAAAQNNGVGIAGIASRVKIMAIRTVPSRGDETDVDVVESFIYAAKNGARLINCSFGKAHNEGGMAVKEAIDFIGKEYGTLVFAASGNDSSFFSKHDIDKSPRWPASYDSETLVVVASTTSAGKLSSFSNIGKVGVDLAAPGSSIYSTIPGNKYASMSGTSMACPTTVGVAAEVLSYFPGLTPAQLKNVLLSSVSQVSSFERYMVSGGRVDLYQSLQFALNNY